MKIFKSLFVSAICALTLISCAKDHEPQLNENVNAKFFSSIGQMDSRASNTTWSANDAIGIYALNFGTTLAAANIYNSGENIQHVTALGDGAFAVVTASEAIQFPANGDALDFIAYYPYKATITNYIYPVDVANQSNLELIDLLYSDNATGNKTTPAVMLQFQHKLSKLIMNITAGTGVTTLAGLTASINNLNTQASFSLVDKTFSGIGSPASLTPTVTIASDNLSATIEAILIPSQDINSAEIVFTLAGKTYTWTPNSKILLSEKKYTYAIEITGDALVPVEPDGNIDNWTEDNTDGPVVIPPDSNPIITPTATQLDFTTAATGSQSLTFDSTEDWTIAADETWVTLTPASGVAGTAISVTVDVDANAAAARTATITITALGGETAAITVNQAGTVGTTTPFDTAWNMFGITLWGDSPMGVSNNTNSDVVIGGLTKAGYTTSGAPGANNWGGVDFSGNIEADRVSAPSKYASFTISSTKTISVSELTAVLRITATGPINTSVQYSLDGTSFTEATVVAFAKPSSTTTFPREVLDLSGIAALQNVATGTTITIRLVPYFPAAAVVGTGNWYLNSANTTTDALTVSGTVTD